MTPGTYYFAVGDNNLEADDAQGNRIQDNDSGVLDPNGVLAQWEYNGDDDGPYEILFSGANNIENCDDGVVGGEFLSVDSTALVLAGLQSSAIWMLPVLAGAVGAGFAVFKLRRN